MSKSLHDIFCVFRGASVNAMNENGLTPLMLAVQKDNSKIARSLIEEVGARIDIGDVSEKTAMFLAAEENSVESLRVCITVLIYRL